MSHTWALTGGGGQLGLGGAFSSKVALVAFEPSMSSEQASSADHAGGGGVSSSLTSSADHAGGRGVSPSFTSWTAEPSSSADHDGGGGVLSSSASSAHHEGGGGVVSNAGTHGALVGNHVGGKGRPLSSLPTAFSTWESSADHVGGGGTMSLSPELVNCSTNPMQFVSSVGGALNAWGMSETGTSVVVSKPGGAFIDARDTILLKPATLGNSSMFKPGGGASSGGDSSLGTSSTSFLEIGSSTSGASNCGDGHHQGAGGTFSFAKVDTGAYNAASSEIDEAFTGLNASLKDTVGEERGGRLFAKGLNGSSSLEDSRQPSDEDPPVVDSSSAESSPSSSFD